VENTLIKAKFQTVFAQLFTKKLQTAGGRIADLPTWHQVTWKLIPGTWQV
jgi:hypothetical protein